MTFHLSATRREREESRMSVNFCSKRKTRTFHDDIMMKERLKCFFLCWFHSLLRARQLGENTISTVNYENSRSILKDRRDLVSSSGDQGTRENPHISTTDAWQNYDLPKVKRAPLRKEKGNARNEREICRQIPFVRLRRALMLDILLLETLIPAEMLGIEFNIGRKSFSRVAITDWSVAYIS